MCAVLFRRATSAGGRPPPLIVVELGIMPGVLNQPASADAFWRTIAKGWWWLLGAPGALLCEAQSGPAKADTLARSVPIASQGEAGIFWRW